MTQEELRQFDTTAVRIATAAGLVTDKETRKKLIFAALRYEIESSFFELPRSFGRADPLEGARAAIDSLRSVKLDPFSRYYLARSLYVVHRQSVATGNAAVDELADLKARFLGDHARIDEVNDWDTALDQLLAILESAQFFAAAHSRLRGENKGLVAERWLVYRLALVWKDATGLPPTFSRATPSTKETKGKQVLKRTGFNAFALDFLAAVGATVGDEFASDTWKRLKLDAAEFGEVFDPANDHSWRILQGAMDEFDTLFVDS